MITNKFVFLRTVYNNFYNSRLNIPVTFSIYSYINHFNIKKFL